MEMYLYILDLKKCIHVENFQELQNITEYVHNDVFLDENQKSNETILY